MMGIVAKIAASSPEVQQVMDFEQSEVLCWESKNPWKLGRGTLLGLSGE